MSASLERRSNKVRRALEKLRTGRRAKNNAAAPSRGGEGRGPTVQEATYVEAGR